MASYSLREAAALANVSEKVIRHELARGVARVKSLRAGRAHRLRLSSDQVFYYFLLREFPVTLSPSDRRDLFRLISLRRPSEGRWSASRNRLKLRGGVDLEIDLTSPRRSLRQRLDLYQKGLRRVVSQPDTLGGEPIFLGTRIPVRHIGILVEKGAPVSEILSDFPALSENDVGFARLYIALQPGPGRPRRKLQLKRPR